MLTNFRDLVKELYLENGGPEIRTKNQNFVTKLKAIGKKCYNNNDQHDSVEWLKSTLVKFLEFLPDHKQDETHKEKEK